MTGGSCKGRHLSLLEATARLSNSLWAAAAAVRSQQSYFHDSSRFCGPAQYSVRLGIFPRHKIPVSD
jgi:hypothetical protein